MGGPTSTGDGNKNKRSGQVEVEVEVEKEKTKEKRAKKCTERPFRQLRCIGCPEWMELWSRSSCFLPYSPWMWALRGRRHENGKIDLIKDFTLD